MVPLKGGSETTWKRKRICSKKATMATGNADTTSKEHQVLKKHYARLTKAITNPAILVDLSGSLFSANLISESTKTKVTNENSDLKTKSDCILNELMAVIKQDCSKFTKVISVLEDIPPILSAIANKMKRECDQQNESTVEPSTITSTPPTTVVQNTSKVESIDFTRKSAELGSLVVKIRKEAESAHINIDELKGILLVSHQEFEEEIQNAKDLSRVFVVTGQKICTPDNIEVLKIIVRHFELYGAQRAIQEFEEKNGIVHSDIHQPNSETTITPSNTNITQNVPRGESVDNSIEREVIHTEVCQDQQPLPVDISQTVPQQQSQLPNVPKKTMDVNKHGDDIGDSSEDSATGLYTPTLQELSTCCKYDLLVIGSFGEVSDSQNIHIARKVVLNDHQDRFNQWVTKETDLIRDMHKKVPYCNNMLVFSDLPGNEHSKDYYLEKIRNFLTDSKQDLVIIWYTGNGEKNTGNWCFKDGVITFQDIFGLYMECFRRKRLTIRSDCSYSGSWIKDCVKTLDDHRILSCGHRTGEQGIFLKIYCSCGADEEATALCYITEANEFDKINKFVVVDNNKMLSSGQTTKYGDFRQIRCSKTDAETCEIVDSKCTWEDRIFYKGHLVFLVHGKDRDKPVWHYVLLDNEDKVEGFKAKVNTGIIDIADYGKVLHSGWGYNPLKHIVRKVNLRFSPCINPED